MKKILIIGYETEVTIQHFVYFLQENSAEFEVLNLAKIKDAKRVVIEEMENNLIITIDHKTYNLDEYKSFYARYYYYQLENKFLCECLSKVLNALNAYLNNTKSLVINRPLGGKTNDCKLYHLILLKKSGFNIPSSFIFGSKCHAEKIIETKNNWISKGCSGTRTIVEVVEDDLYSSLHKLEFCPSQFQKRIVGSDVRLHVVGKEFIGLKIDSKVVDYRYASRQGFKNKFKIISIPESIKESCLNFCNKEKLLFSGFDFKIDKKSNDWFVLEANPMPGYEFFDKKVNGAISEKLLDLLLSDLSDPYVNKFFSPTEFQSFIGSERIPLITPF